GITGTNGKTTTTALTGEVLSAGERPVIVGGNIGDTVLDRVEVIAACDLVVLGLASFQLESVERPHLPVGVILNITPDHLDRHHTLDRYMDLKARAIEFAEPDDYAVLNSRDELVRGLASRTRGRVVWFDQHQPLPPMSLPGRHNMENALAAAAVGRIAGSHVWAPAGSSGRPPRSVARGGRVGRGRSCAAGRRRGVEPRLQEL